MTTRKMLIGAAAVAALTAISATALAADNIVQGTWYAAYFGETVPSPVTGPGSSAGTNPSGVLAPSGSVWTITLTSAESLTVTDVEDSGDQFAVTVNGNPVGLTSTPVPGGAFVGECISCALANPDFSRGVFFLPVGTDTFSLTYEGSIGEGDVDFYVGSPQTAVPEPAAWALMLAGFAGLGLAMRSRRRSAAPA